MVSSGKVGCIVFDMHVEYLLLHVMCVLMHVHVIVGVNVSSNCSNHISSAALLMVTSSFSVKARMPQYKLIVLEVAYELCEMA